MGIFKAMFVIRQRFAWAALAAALATAAGCHRFDPRSFSGPEALFRGAMREFRAGRFQRAQAAFQQLTFDVPPRDTLLPKVRYFLAECQFGQRDFVTAAREFRRVADEFPTDSLAPWALLRTGDAYAELWRRPELDPSNAQTAVATYQELQGRYPDARGAVIAGARLRQLNELFATKEYENGLFYFRRRAWDSAILYFKNLIATYPSASLVPDAYVRLVRAYGAIGYREEMQEVCETVRRFYGARADVRRACGGGGLRR